MSWSLDTWGNQDRLDAASQFLSTGIVSTVFGGTGCTDSSQCASGFKCSGGRCVQITTSGGSGGSGGDYISGGGGGAGSCDGGPDGNNSSGNGTGGCSSPTPTGPNGGGNCTTSTCGQDGPNYGTDSDCCGERCCRYFGTGTGINVNCYCGGCPGTNGSRCGEGLEPCGPGLACVNGYCTEPKPCNKFCADYYEANGVEGAGCDPEWRCDECTECAGTFEGGGNYCTGKASLPCHCNGAEIAECDICNSDGSVSPGVCLECCEVVNKLCSCGVMVAAKSCQPKGISGLSVCTIAANAAAEECAKQCAGPGQVDPCAGACEGQIQNGSGPCPDPNDPIDCPDGSNCNWTGCIEANGNHSILYDQCDMANVPEECKACDCNCHNDCPACQLCGADGQCYVDPTCEETQDPVSVTITVTATEYYESYFCNSSPCYGQIIGAGIVDVNTNTYTISYANFTGATVLPPDPGRACDNYVQYRAANGSMTWYESGRRAFGGPIVNNHCPGSSYDCPACNGNRTSTWFIYQSSYSFNY